jgi:RHS repeat-associated protein
VEPVQGNGRRLGEAGLACPRRGYAGGRHLATYSGGTSGTTYFNHVDWLGTERARTTVTGALYETCTSLPFGDGLSCSGSDPSPLHFTGLQRDWETVTDHAWFRQYSSLQGRWLTPDPAGLNAVNPTNPQSWNRYSYVLDDPLDYVDPTGTNCVLADIDFFPIFQLVPNGEGGWNWRYKGDLLHMTYKCDGGGGRDGKGGGGFWSGLKNAVCSAIPSGRTTGVSEALGAVGSVEYTAEVVTNYNTGETSGFVSGGMQGGWNGGAQATVFTGFIYGLGSSNSNYSGGFTTLSGGAGLGGFISKSSGGLNGKASGIVPSGKVTVVGASVGSSLIPGPTGGVAVTNYSDPPPMGNLSPSNPLDLAFYAARQACK